MSIYAQFKTCPKCGIEKPISEFNKNKKRKDGLSCYCRHCNKEYYINNKQKHNSRMRELYILNRERCVEYQSLNKDRIKKTKAKWYQDTKEERREKRRNYNKNRKQTEPLFKLKCNIRTLIINSIKKGGYKKNTKTANILGCEYEYLMEHLESQFDTNMNWSNHGTYWDIDHIIPVSSAKTEEDIIKLNHYTNLQPLESTYNRNIKRANIL
jgi:hypothetical protein